MAKVLVVGGAGGVGGALIARLLVRGEQVTTTVLDAAQQTQVQDSYEGQVPAVAIDLADAATTLREMRSVIAGMGRLDAVVVCAAISPYGPIETTPLEVFAKSYDINTIAGVAVFQAAMPALRATRGRIVFMSSTAGRAAMPFIGAYVGSKYALEGMADVMRREVAPQGVKISLIEPGAIRTGMLDDQLRTIKDRIANLPSEERALYGKWYTQFEALATQSRVTIASTAEQVADVILEALTAAEPQSRYIVGDDGKQVLAAAAQLSDAQLDALFVQMFGMG